MSHTSQFDDLQFMTVAEVAAILRVSRMTVYRMIHEGILEAQRVGRGFRIRAQVVREYLRITPDALGNAGVQPGPLVG